MFKRISTKIINKKGGMMFTENNTPATPLDDAHHGGYFYVQKR